VALRWRDAIPYFRWGVKDTAPSSGELGRVSSRYEFWSTQSHRGEQETIAGVLPYGCQYLFCALVHLDEREGVAARNVVVDDGSDVPLTVLYGGLGRDLARQFNTLSAQQKTQACDAIEKEMTCSDSRRVELVATLAMTWRLREGTPRSSL
jgi:hypothetical protein